MKAVFHRGFRVCLALWLATSGGAQGEVIESSEQEVKAAFVYNFAKFVQWPEPDGAPTPGPIRICILGTNPFGSALERAVRGKSVNNRKVVILYPRSSTQASECELAFIPASEEPTLGEILARLGPQPILTVSDIQRFSEQGGVIGLKMDKNRVRFEVNMVAARKAGLKLSSQLLRVASHVTGQLDDAGIP